MANFNFQYQYEQELKEQELKEAEKALDFQNLLLNFFLTAIAYLIIPLLICVFCQTYDKKLKKKHVITIIVINAIVVYSIFTAINSLNGTFKAANVTATWIWSGLGYFLMSKLCMERKKKPKKEAKVEEKQSAKIEEKQPTSQAKVINTEAKVINNLDVEFFNIYANLTDEEKSVLKSQADWMISKRK